MRKIDQVLGGARCTAAASVYVAVVAALAVVYLLRPVDGVYLGLWALTLPLSMLALPFAYVIAFPVSDLLHRLAGVPYGGFAETEPLPSPWAGLEVVLGVVMWLGLWVLVAIGNVLLARGAAWSLEQLHRDCRLRCRSVA